MCYYGFLARCLAILHKIRHPFHKVRWRRIDALAKSICSGDIICEDCEILFWCRGVE